jgi:hypothetical protein
LADQFEKNADALAGRLRFNDVSDNKCARGFTATLAGIAKAIVNEPTNMCVPVTQPEQRRTAAETCLNAFDDGFFKALEAQKQLCASDDVEPLQVVNQQFRQLVNNWRPEKLKVEVTFKNRPVTHFGFGILSSFAFSGKTKEPRAKVDEGVLVEDPSREL